MDDVKAIVLHECGGPDVLSHEEVPTPQPGPGEALIRVRSVGVNRTLDITIRAGEYPRPVAFPHVLGADPAGVVEAVGADVAGLDRGQRVAVFGGLSCGRCRYCVEGHDEDCVNRRYLGVHQWGGYAQYVVAPATVVFPIPDDLPFADASFIFRHFPTAFGQLEASADVQPGETVLVMGASGGLGLCAIQVAKLVGARVIAAAGGDERLEVAASFGADFTVNYRREDLAARVMEMTEGKGVEVVCENVGDPHLWQGAFNSLA
ncbi:MAG: alcohol dehydrogenase catalytic domain-containing protein, partial [Nitriliruptorales bacterium]|nr:alcohol dehydrogenase catalytic domain-containing protein [Nitriliruptorales bacterium]